MKSQLLPAILLIFHGTFAQPVSPDNPASRNLDSLLSLSKKFRWIDPERSLMYADQATSAAQQNQDRESEAKARILKGFAFWTFGDNELAIQESLSAIEISLTLQKPIIESEALYVLARGYMDVGESEKALEALRKAGDLANAGEDWELITSIENLKGVVQFIDHHEDSALFYYMKAYEIGNSHHIDPVNLPRIISNIGECYLAENRTLGFSYFNQALELARKTSNRIAEASITGIIGQAHQRFNELEKAESNLGSALSLARELGLRRVVRQAYSGLVEIRLKQGRANEAVTYLRKYYEVRDSLLGKSKIRQIVELESRYELELKEKDIRILEDEKRIQQIGNRVLAGTIVLLVMGFTGLYFLQKYRHRKNREMLNLEIDYLSRQHREMQERMKANIILASDQEGEMESMEQQLLRKAVAVVESNLQNTQFSVEQLADELHMSRTSLHRKIKSITGFPPNELIRSIRLRKAARMILHKTDSISQIALQVGFDDYSHFSKSFKKHFGVAPAQYEDQAKRLQEIGPFATAGD